MASLLFFSQSAPISAWNSTSSKALICITALHGNPKRLSLHRRISRSQIICASGKDFSDPLPDGDTNPRCIYGLNQNSDSFQLLEKETSQRMVSRVNRFLRFLGKMDDNVNCSHEFLSNQETPHNLAQYKYLAQLD